MLISVKLISVALEPVSKLIEFWNRFGVLPHKLKAAYKRGKDD
jgi:hypothetical protein